ncbi:MAG: glycosyltransferase family 39 protein [Patescibacteria group bacterium]
MVYPILFLALLLRVINLNQSLWLDEGTSAILARDFTFGRILTEFSPGDFHPPFYYLTLKAWAGFLGYSEIALRSLSVFFGLGSIYLTYLIGKKLLGKRVGIISALFLATSGLHIYYSHEARMYMMSLFLVTALFYFFLKILEEKRVTYWVVFAILLLVNGLTDYLPNLIIVVFFVYAFLIKKNKSWWRNFLLSFTPLLLGFFFFLPTLARQLASGLGVATSAPNWWQVLGKTSLKELALIPIKFAIGRVSFLDKRLYALIVGGILAIYALIFLRLRNFKDKKLQLIWLWLVVPMFLAAVLGLRISVFSYFRLIFVLPAFFILLAAGIVRLNRRFFVPAFVFILLVNVISSSAYLFNPRFQREDWRGAASFIKKESKGNSAVVFVRSQTEAYKYYAKDAKIALPEELDRSLDEVWLMRYVQPIFDPEDTVRKRVEGLGFEKAREYDFDGVVVWRYQK